MFRRYFNKRNATEGVEEKEQKSLQLTWERMLLPAIASGMGSSAKDSGSLKPEEDGLCHTCQTVN